MIITCPNCNKQFKIDNSLVPNEGRDLQCGSCNHVWFFKKQKIDFNKDVIKKDISEIPKKDLKIETDKVEKIDKIINRKNKALVKYKKSSFTFLKFLRYIIVFVL